MGKKSEFLISGQSRTGRSDEAVSAQQLRTTQGTQQRDQRKPHKHDLSHSNMMEVVLTRLRDFSCKTSTFDDRKAAAATVTAAGPTACRDPRSRTEGCTAGDEGRRLDIESALAWLRRELMEMRSQDQALIRQLMELHSGIQELKQELSEEEEEEEETDEEEEEEEEEEGSYWDSESERGSGSVYSGSGEVGFSFMKSSPSHYAGVSSKRRAFSRRSSVP